ncbi:uncharacterized protein LOC124408126 [Diprion similis]|uniref:uncharacterized protein LOC124408126 n=1 Tax=Diprion similis TaxID=362088 RepID=UPI001EF9955E|nr:uncharacterized protein LOC124408126 [Diprion similis]XP_046740802.1 uncharacterized protein LOC124408126 [Diprion similis]XP_046740803.1 uncharacterized protein LOC124408126 [Diprion similis]
MNKTGRLMFRIYVATSNLINSLPNRSRFFYTPNTSLSYASYSKDYRSSHQPSNRANDSDAVSQALATVQTTEELFEIVSKYRPLLKIEHSLAAFKILASKQRQESKVDSTIAKKAEFLKLCRVVVNDSKSLDVNDAVFIFKTLNYLGISNNSWISQSLLEVIRNSLNDLSFLRLVELEHELQEFASSPLSTALKIVVPELCEFRLQNIVVDKKNIVDVASALTLLHNKPGRNKLIANVVSQTRKIGQSRKVSYGVKRFRSLCRHQYHKPGYEEAVQNSQQILIKYMSCVEFDDIHGMVRMMRDRKCLRHKIFRNAELMDAFGNAIIARNEGFSRSTLILYLLQQLNYMHIPLRDYATAECIQNLENLCKYDGQVIMMFVISLASFNYKPTFWNTMQPIILKIIHRDLHNLNNLLRLSIGLAILDCFDTDILELVFSERFLVAAEVEKIPMKLWNLLLLYQSIHTLCSIPVKKSLPKRILENAMKVNETLNIDSSLLPVLERAMGGSQYVIRNLWTKLGHYIEHIVIMRKGGYAVSLNLSSEETNECKPITYIEDLQVPSESQVIIVKPMPVAAYAHNSQHLRGTWILLLKTLEKQTGHAVVPINLTTWNALRDYEKIPHLMQAIRLKCDYMSEAANVS